MVLLALLLVWLVLPTMRMMNPARIRASCAALLVAAALAPIVPTGSAGAASPPHRPRVRELQERDRRGQRRGGRGAQRARRDPQPAPRARRRGRRVRRQIREVEAPIAAIQAEVDRFTAEAVAREAEAAAARAQLDEAKRRAADAAAAMYRGEDGVEVYAEVLDVDNVQDAFVGDEVPRAHRPSVRRAEVESLAGLKVQIETAAATSGGAARRGRAPSRSKREGERDADRRRCAPSSSSNADASRAGGGARTARSSRRSSARKDQFADELASLQATSTAVSQILAARQRGQKRARRRSASCVRCPGPITGAFGNRGAPDPRNDAHPHRCRHAGRAGQPIKARRAGVVAWAGPRGGYGNTVIIDHGNQFATLYGHASALRVSVGQTVEAGQVVALAGSTGMATGPHLHFEVRILGVPVNPVSYME